MIRVEIPVWLAKKNGIPTAMKGEVEAETEKAILFSGNGFAEKRVHCMRCGRELTHPSSRLVGYGPTCCGYLGIYWPDKEELSEKELERVKKEIEGITWKGWLPKSKVEIIGDYEVKKKKQKKAFIGLCYERLSDGEYKFKGLMIKSPYKDKPKVDEIRREVKGKWNPRKKFWTFPMENKVIEMVKRLWGDEIDFTDGLKDYLEKERKEKQERLEEKEKEDAKLKTDLKQTLYPYQRVGVSFLSKAGSAILGDDMGLGKTLQALATVDEIGAQKVLIVCPNTLKGVWAKEIDKFLSGEEYAIVDGGKKKKLNQIKAGKRFTIINYEAIRQKEKELTEEGKELAKKDWDVIIFDEAHRIKNRKAQQTKACLKVAKKAKRVYHLTGTPIMNKPYEIWTLLNAINPDKYTSFWRFVDLYCEKWHNGWGWEIGKAKNPEEFREFLAPIMLRRKKEDVLDDLPSKTTQQIPVQLKPKERKLYNQMRDEMVAELSEKDSVSAPVIIAQITRLKQICVSSELLKEKKKSWNSKKIETLLDIISDSNGQGIVVFSQFKEAIKLVSKALENKGIGYSILTGDSNQKQRERAIESFQKGETKVFLTTIQAGGQGITLTAGSIAVFLDKHWTPAINNQAVDRIYRIGQEKPVTIYELFAEDTIEQWIEELLEEKSEIFKQLIEKSDGVDSTQILSQIFGKEVN